MGSTWAAVLKAELLSMVHKDEIPCQIALRLSVIKLLVRFFVVFLTFGNNKRCLKNWQTKGGFSYQKQWPANEKGRKLRKEENPDAFQYTGW